MDSQDICHNLIIGYHESYCTIPSVNKPFSKCNFYINNVYPSITPTPCDGVIRWTFENVIPSQDVQFKKEDLRMGEVFAIFPVPHKKLTMVAEIKFENGLTCIKSKEIGSQHLLSEK